MTYSITYSPSRIESCCTDNIIDMFGECVVSPSGSLIPTTPGGTTSTAPSSLCVALRGRTSGAVRRQSESTHVTRHTQATAERTVDTRHMTHTGDNRENSRHTTHDTHRRQQREQSTHDTRNTQATTERTVDTRRHTTHTGDNRENSRHTTHDTRHTQATTERTVAQHLKLIVNLSTNQLQYPQKTFLFGFVTVVELVYLHTSP